MQAIVVRKHGGPEVLHLEPVPDPRPGPLEAVVEVRAVGVNHLDVWVRRGVPGHEFPLPLIPGSDVSGVVREVGAAVTGVCAGEEVIVAPGLSCGRCAACLSGRDSQCPSFGILGETRDGGYAELVAVPAVNLIPKPASFSFAAAAALGVPFLTAWHMLCSRAELRQGETVLVQAGGSGVGSAAIQIARLWHATVITTVGSAEKGERARGLGADHVIDYSRDDVVRAVKEITGGRGVDVVIEHVGGAAFTQSLRALARQGRLVTCGATTGAEITLNLRHLFFKGLSVLGSTMGNRSELLEVIAHAAASRLRPVLHAVLPLAEAGRAQELLEERRVFGKLVLEVAPG